MLPIPDNLAYAIEEKTWGKSIDTLDEKNQTEEILNGHITCTLRAWNTIRITDRALWNDFHEEFNGCTLDIFKVANKTALRMLRLHLTTHGVWIRDTQHEWTKEDIEDHLKEHPDNFNSRWNPARDQSWTIRPSTTRATTVNPLNPQTAQNTAVKPPIEPVDPRWEEARSATLDTAHRDNHIQQQSNYGRFQQNLQDRLLPRMTEEITRQYSNTDDKYGGGLYDDLNSKLVRFYDVCENVDMPHGPTKFRSTIVKPFYREEYPEGEGVDENVDPEPTDEPDEPVETQRRRRGRPLGSKNKPKQQTIVRRSNRRNAPDHQDLEDQFVNAIQEGRDVSIALMTKKELPFEQSQNKEIKGLIAKGVFDFVQYNPTKHADIRVFNSRLVNEIKGKATDTPFKEL
ncbi:hypothetical protein N7486_000007 [Penicillium sp. IBT 16267x]|nr:hypothetical protein N7486_000007 [Penicillium sp. IBT 16267x]